MDIFKEEFAEEIPSTTSVKLRSLCVNQSGVSAFACVGGGAEQQSESLRAVAADVTGELQDPHARG